MVVDDDLATKRARISAVMDDIENIVDLNGLVQERHNSSVLELRLSCTNPSICSIWYSWTKV